MCAYTYFDTEMNCLKWPMINVSKTGNTKSFSKTIYGAPYWVNKKYMVLFSPDFKYKVDSFNLYITDNYVKRTIGGCLPQIE